jgi:MFS superfamily sulfate permease-like transporter
MHDQTGAASRIAEYLPAAEWLRAYRRPWLPGDLAAGVTTAAVVIPQGMAYATIAGLPVQAGLYVATVPMLVYALLGTSRPLNMIRRLPDAAAWERRLFRELDDAVATFAARS